MAFMHKSCFTKVFIFFASIIIAIANNHWQQDNCARTRNREDYRGNIAVTKSGLPCDRWEGHFWDAESAPEYDLVENFCRNPNGSAENAFCFKHTPQPWLVDWEFCDVPLCADYQDPWRKDRRCGRYYPINGKPAECDPNGEFPCCSRSGWCENTNEHCDCDGCVNYKSMRTWRWDSRCGRKFLHNGLPGHCEDMCCSRWGWCGLSPAYCNCHGCTDYRKKGEKKFRKDGRCGLLFPINGQASECNPNSDAPCCSNMGYCGNTAEHCHCRFCKNYKNLQEESLKKKGDARS